MMIRQILTQNSVELLSDDAAPFATRPKQRSTVKPIVRALFNYYSLDHRIKCSFK